MLGYTSYSQQKLNFNNDWQFIKAGEQTTISKVLRNDVSDTWQTISMPHTANIEPIEKQVQQWQGIAFYKKTFSVPLTLKGKHVALQFDAAMQQADVYLNGKHIITHFGGYLPFYIDISDQAKYGTLNTIVVQLDNRDNANIPPGKPIKDLDFNYYSGIYRNVWMIVKNKLHISNAIAANRIAGGGILTNYKNVSKTAATLEIKTDISNHFASAKNAQVRTTLKDGSGKTVAKATAPAQTVAMRGYGVFKQELKITNPILWSPEAPYLYQLIVELLQDGKITDTEIIKTGIKSIRMASDGFYLNDARYAIRGTNRHQEYPYVGNALSDNAQYRDAYKIKSAGFNFVRLSHYPQSPAFMDACDELGILVMDAIPGWQFFGGDAFKKNSFQDIRDMIRRDRNHTSVIMWEASLNESGMSKEYMQQAHAIVHEELPYEHVYSAGWVDEAFDVFLPARQHGKAPNYLKKYSKDKPLLIAEYGDWEYYAQNAGFNQTAFKDLQKDEKTSRQLRGFGEKRLLQQALNYQEAHNDNLYSKNIGDANWLMFDYKRGYADDIESSGIMDIVRLPKFAFYFYQSQRDAKLKPTSEIDRPMLFIANYWNDKSDTTIKIFSNCSEVELMVNGKIIARQQPDKDQYSTNLKHPPFTFHLDGFTPGSITATGYMNNSKVVQHIVSTPGTAAALKLWVNYSNKPLKAGEKDAVFVYAAIVDVNGTILPEASEPIDFKVNGNAEIISPQQVKAEAGIAAILLQAGSQKGKVMINAQSGKLTGTVTIDIK